MAQPTSPLRWPRRLLGLLAAVVLLLGAAHVALPRLFPPERLAALLAQQVRSATGRDFAVRGPLSIRLLPRLGVAADDLALGNAPWGTRPQMLQVRHARFDIALWPLLRGAVHIASVSLEGVDLLLETDRSGAGNWVMGGTAAQAGDGHAPAGSDGAPPRLQLQRIRLSDAKLSYRDGRSGTRRDAAVSTLDIDADGDGQTLAAAFDTGAMRWQLKGRTGKLAELATPQADWPFDLQLDADGATLGAKGVLRGGTPRTVQAGIRASLTRAVVLAPWVADASRVPLPVELKGQLTYAPAALRIDALQLSLAGQQLSGQLTAQGGEPWRIDARLASPSIDLARWLPPSANANANAGAGAGAGAGAAPQPAGGRLFGGTPLPFDALPAGPATLALQVDRLLLPGAPPLSQLKLQLRAQPGRFEAESFSAELAGGSVHGSLAIASAAGAAPRVALQLQADKLSLDPLLQASGHAAYARGGQLQLRTHLDLAGRTPQALASSASGELMLSLSGTTLGSGAAPLGADVLRRLLRAVTLQPQAAGPVRIDCAVLRLPLKNGVAAVDRSIALETAQLALSAKGEVRFDDETLALAFRPSPKAAPNINPLNLAQLVVLQGPWRDPKLALDAKGVAGMAATLGLAGATGGLSMLAQQLLKAAPEKDVCRAAMTGQASAAAAAPSAQGQGPSKAPAQLPQGLPEALRRIFK